MTSMKPWPSDPILYESNADYQSALAAAWEQRCRKLYAAAVELSAMYGHAWDRVDGALIMMGGSVPRFEKAHEVMSEVLSLLDLPKEE
jgi:hypothetical protein